jgi:hypothetical protein
VVNWHILDRFGRFGHCFFVQRGRLICIQAAGERGGFMPGLSYAIVLGAVFAGLAGGAYAQGLGAFEETAAAPDGGQFTIWVGGTYFNAPVANGLGTVGDDANYNFEQQTDNGAALAKLGGSAGLSIWKPTEVYTFYAAIDADLVHAENSYSMTIDVPGPFDPAFLDILPLTGEPTAGSIADDLIDGDIVDSATTIDYGRVNAAIGVGPGEDVPVAFGLFASAGQLHLVSEVTTTVNPAAFAILDETVSMFSAGPMVAGEWTNSVGDTVDLTLSGRAALLGAFGSLTAAQTADGENSLDLETTADAAAVAGLVEVRATLDVAASDDVNLFVFGEMGARNDYFSIVNPRSGPGLAADDPTSYDPGPVRLEQGLLLNAKAGVGLSGTF